MNLTEPVPCPCGLPQNYDACCGIFHSGSSLPLTAEALMRSRYSAFAKQDITYLKETTWPPNQKYFDEAGYRDRASNSIWLGLTIHQTETGMEHDTRGTVTFTAKSMMNSQIQEQTEKSLFRKKNNRWYYVKSVG